MINDDVKKIVNHCLCDYVIDKNYIQQVKEEFTMLAYFLAAFKPNNILEIGCRGGTFFLFNKFSTGKKIGIDINDDHFLNMHFYTYNEDFTFINADSQLQHTANIVGSMCNSFDFIFIDGDHSYNGVKKDFELYKKYLSPRGYIAFHDIDPNHVFKDSAGGQVYKFWQDLNYGSKTEIICSNSTSDYTIGDHRKHFGGIGLWHP